MLKLKTRVFILLEKKPQITEKENALYCAILGHHYKKVSGKLDRLDACFRGCTFVVLQFAPDSPGTMEYCGEADLLMSPESSQT